MIWIKNLTIVVISTVFSLLALELGLRLIYPNKIVEQQATRDHSDPLIPRHMAGTHINPIRNSIATFDEFGMRYNPNRCSTDDEINVLLVGDSNIAGLFLDDTETLGAKITEQSIESERCIAVDTFGVSGFGPDQALFAVSDLTKNRAYDYVIFHIFADNDLGDLIRNNNFLEGEDRLINAGYCFPERPLLEGFLTYKSIRKALHVVGIDFNLYGSAVASNQFDNNCVVILHPNQEKFSTSMHLRAQFDWEANRINQQQIYMGDRYDIEFACNSNVEATQYVTQYFKRVILEASELATERKFKLVYLIQPSEDDVTNNHEERLDKGCGQYKTENLSQFFVEALDGLDFINLYERFLNCNACYFTEKELSGDNHWSPYGVGIAASKVVEIITESTND